MAGEGGALTPLQQALAAVKEMRARLDAAEAARREPIAIVGAGLRLPGGVTDLASYWQLLLAERDAVGPVPADRWDADAWFDPNPETPGRMTVREAGFLGDVAGFDAAFFGISPREAAEMDPSQRLLLEVAWEALEHAAISPGALHGTDTGVFIGLGLSDYSRRHFLHSDATKITAYAGTGSFLSVAAGRISYSLGLNGPAVTVDTACSSSLVAVHLAMASLRNSETRVALAGGVNLLLAPEPSVYFSKLNALSPDGRCKAFDARADGYGRGEGAGLVVLKRLSDAVADGDRVLGVLRGSAVNQDGRSNGLTAPSGRAQQAVIRAALGAAGVAPSDVEVIEAHGTGTPLGDPIEFDALREVFSEPGPRVWLGSAKTNFGHLETAAGIAGLLKLTASLAKRRVPRHLHLDRPNPRLRLADSRLALPSSGAVDLVAARPIGGVSSFGLSGTNAHVVVQAPPERAAGAAPLRPLAFLTLSARTAVALKELAGAWSSALASDLAVHDAAATAWHGRAHLSERLVVVSDDPGPSLAAFARGEPLVGSVGTAPASPPSVTFLCTGQGAQRAGMALELLATEPRYAEVFDRVAAIVDGELPRPLRALLSDADALADTRVTQVALFATELAMAAWWRDAGVEPDALVGHSVGEFVAAVLADAIDLEDAARLVALRGRLMAELPRDGAMIAIFASESDVRAALAGSPDVDVAGINGPTETVVSGRKEQVEAVAAGFVDRGVRTRPLKVSHAFHSPLMEPILDRFEAACRDVSWRSPKVPIYSNLDGSPVGERLRQPSYWRQHVRQAVRFADGLRAMATDFPGVVLEIGPAPILSALGVRLGLDGVRFVASSRGDGNEVRELLEAAGELHIAGVALRADRLVSGRRETAPTYAWQRERHWIASDAAPAEPDGRFVERVWEAVDLDADPVAGRWMLVGDPQGRAVALAEGLRAAGVDVRVVAEADAIGDPEIGHLVDCRPLERGDGDPDGLAEIATGTLVLLQAAARHRGSARVSVVVDVHTSRFHAQAAGAVEGIVAVARVEHPDRVGRVVLDASGSDGALVRALLANGRRDLQARTEGLFGARLAPVRLGSGQLPISASGRWLVTGGFGAVGQSVVADLIQRGARAVVVAGRYVDAAREAQIEAWRAGGADVVGRAVDVTDAAAVTALVAASSDWEGVIHLAGTVEDAPLARVDRSQVADALGAKAVAAGHLADAFAGVPLRAFVLVSSAAPTIGTAGQAAYAAANGALDGLARWRVQAGEVATSVAFGPWDGVGMAGRVDDAVRLRWAEQGLNPISPSAALASLGRVVASGRPHVVVSAFDWARVAEHRPHLGLPVARMDAVGSAPAAESGWQALRGEARQAALSDLVMNDVARILGLADGQRLDPDVGFFDAGLDSLTAVELRQRVGRTVGRELSPTVAFDHPSVRRLVRHLLVDVFALDGATATASMVQARDASEPVAIVGAACRLPGEAHGLPSLWRNLLEGVDAIEVTPPERFDVERWFDPTPATPGRLSSRFGGFVRGIEDFDPGFFGISPREAASLDPQQRMLLEAAVEALEDAAIPPPDLVDRPVGVFVGIGTSEYWRRFDPLTTGVDPDPYSGTGNEPSFAAGRISYVLGLRGPSWSVNTACSSSLVALHQAVAALRNGECDVALVGGVNAIVGPETTILMSQLRALSPDGRCKTFDARANGYVRAEGVGMVAVRRLSDAVRDGDRVLAVVRGTAVNHDGRSSGLTVPSGPAQQSVLRDAVAAAGVAPETVGYVECHGTGTSLGDPIEVTAIGQVYGDRQTPLHIGSIKTNVGHLEAGAGIAGLLKAVLAVQNGVIPPHLHLASPNPALPLDAFPVDIPVVATPWEAEGPRRAGISSFGISGTNAHVIIEQGPERPAPPAGPRGWHTVAVSGRTEGIGRSVAASLADAIEQGALSPADVAETMNLGRAAFSVRAVAVGPDAAAVVRQLRGLADGGNWRSASTERVRIAFLCTGAGPQQAGMGRRLYEREPAFREAFDACCAIADTILPRPLKDVIFPADGDDAALHELAFTQPAMFAIEWAVAALWRSWGIVPDAVIGHSTGQYVAATLAGVFSLDDGMRLMCERAAMMSSLPHDGEMVAVFAPEARVRDALLGHEADIAIAAVNGVAETVISGRREPVVAVADRLEAQGLEIRRLRISHAAHSPLMEPILAAFERRVGQTTLHRPALMLVENVRGEVAGAEVTTAAYWRDHMRQGVRFYEGMRTLADLGFRHFLEIGNHPVLSGAGGRCIEDVEATFYPSLRRGEDDHAQLLETLGRLWSAGVSVDWRSVQTGAPGLRIALPPTPFARKRHWVERTERTATRLAGEGWVHAVRFENPPSVPRVTLPEPVSLRGAGDGLRAALGALAIDRVAEANSGTLVWVVPPASDLSELGSLADDALAATVAAARAGLTLAVVFQGATAAGPALNPAHAGIWGFFQAVSIEMPDLRLIRVDVASDIEPPAQQVVDAIRSGHDAIVLTRGGPKVPRLRLAEPGASAAWSGGGTVIVTGGAGAIGRRVAAWAASQGAESIVLASRRTPTDDEVATLAAEVGAVPVAFVSVDLSEPGAGSVLAQAVAALPPVSAVFHAAGIVADVGLLSLDAASLRRPWGPKVVGSQVLMAAFPGALFVGFSSAAAMIGSAGQANYAVGNAVMDALVAGHRRSGHRAVSIGWGPWAEAGLATEARRAWEAGGVTPMAPSVAIEVLGRLLTAPEPLYAVLAVDGPTFARHVGRVPDLLDAWRGEAPAEAVDRPRLRAELESVPGPRRRGVLADVLTREVAAILGLGVGEVSPAAGFFDIGLDSLMAVELSARLKQGLGIPLPATAAFDHPTVSALSDHLWGRLGFDQADGVEAPVVAHVAIAADEPIAVVGMACRFPGDSDDPNSFWELLRSGRDPVRPVPPDRWDIDALYDARPGTPGKMVAREGGFIDDVDQFDPEFFQISPREAASMDPQQRLFLEVSWEALERAGRTNRGLRDSTTGVFVGVGESGYLDRFHTPGTPLYRDTYAGTGNLGAFVAGRTAYVLGVHGPTLALNTACSSTLVATHLACQALRTGDCDTALAGGVHLMLSPENFIYVSQLKALSPDGRCKTFDASANGYGRSEGAGVLVLRRLSDAQRDGDPILAIVRGTAVNHDGPSSGLTVPNGPAQQAVIRQAVARSGVSPLSISYVEAHGTGTVLGDPIEVHALEAELCQGRSADRPLHLGAVKSNVGHMEVAAGAASLIKMVLALQHRSFPPHLHFSTPNPDIDLEHLPIVIDTAPTPWEPLDGRRLCGVSGFGLAGTNAHVVLEEAPQATPAQAAPDRSQHVLVMSARSEDALRTLAGRYVETLASASLAEVAPAAATRRMPFENRLAVVASSASEARERLQGWREHGGAPGVLAATAGARKPRIAFLFSGQGSQSPGMAKGLYASEPAFKDAFDEVAAALAPYLPAPLASVVWGDDDRVHDTRWTQPALLAVELAVARMWERLGVVPDAVIGHSIGEIAAAHFAGLLSLDDAARLVAERGRLMAELPLDGAMVALFTEEATVRAALVGREATVSIAAVNNGGETVISGATDDVLAVFDELKAKGVDGRRLTVSHAFHSPRMDPMLDAFEAVAASIAWHPAKRLLVSNVTGTWADASAQTARYWRDHVRGTVRFADGVQTLLDAGYDLFLEVGPHPTLLGNVRRIRADLPSGALIPTLKRDVADDVALATALGSLFVRGYEPNWRAWSPPGPWVDLPLTPMDRRRIWLADPEFPTAGERVADALVEVAWRDLPTASRRSLEGTVFVVGGPEAEAAALVQVLTGAGLSAERRTGEPSLDGAGGVVWLGALDADGSDPMRAIAGGTWGAARWAMAMAQTARPVPLWLVTLGAQGDAPTNPSQAALLGLGRVIALEHGELGARRIDLDPSGDRRGLLDALLASDDEAEVRLRDGRRQGRRIVRSATAPAAPVVIRSDRAYLVTGGLGALGRLAAADLVEQGAGEVVLTGRSAPSAEAQADLDAWSARGTTVTVVAADVGDADGARRAVAAATMPLGGIVHAAGVLADAALLRMDEARFMSVMGPKVAGTLNLDRETASMALDFFVLYSGGASLLGSPGQANYAAANAFLDAYAASRRSQGRAMVAINWGAWAEVGMAARLGAGHATRQADEGIGRIAPKFGVTALRRAMAMPVAQVGVLVVDWDRFVQAFHHGVVPPWLRELARATIAPVAAAVKAPSAGGSELQRRLAGAADRAAAVDAFISEHAIAVLGLDRGRTLDPDKPLLDLGLDSLLAVELKNALNSAGVDLPVARVMTGPSVAVLRQMVLAQLETAPAMAEASEGTAAVADTGSRNAVMTHLVAVVVGMAMMAAVFLFAIAQGLGSAEDPEPPSVEQPKKRR